MNKIEFMDRLAELLGDVNETEREDALKYYRDYFEDAGSWNEQNVISELVSPEKVAETIKESFASDETYGYGEDSPAEMAVEVITVESDDKQKENSTIKTEQDISQEEKQSKSLSTGTVIAIVIACILLSPLIFSGVGSICTFIIVVIVLWILLSILIIVGPFALTVGGISAIVSGIIKYMSDAAIGMLLVGSGLIGIGVSLIGYVILWLYFFKLMPKLFRWIFGVGKKGGNK